MVAGLVRVNAVVAGSMMVKAMRSRIHKIARTHVGGGRPPDDENGGGKSISYQESFGRFWKDSEPEIT
jgi:hypothetical protein